MTPEINGPNPNEARLANTQPEAESSIVIPPETADQEHERVGRYFKQYYPYGLPAVQVEQVPVQE